MINLNILYNFPLFCCKNKFSNMTDILKILSLLLLINAKSYTQQVYKIDGSRGGVSPLEISNLTIDYERNRILTGVAWNLDSNDLDPGKDVYNLQDLNKYGNHGFVVSIDKNGQLNYAFAITDHDIPIQQISINQVESDHEGNIYLLGYFMGKADFDPSPEIFELSAPSIYDVRCFLASYNKFGQIRYAFMIPILGNVFPNIDKFSQTKSMSVDYEGNIYLIGSPSNASQGFYDFDPSDETFNTIPGYRYVVQYDNQGNFKFGHQIPYNASAISCDNNGNYVVTGTNSSIDKNYDYDPGPDTLMLEYNDSTAFYVISYSGKGELNYANQFYGKLSIISGNEYYGEAINLKLTQGEDYYVVVGKMAGIIDFDPGSNTKLLNVSLFEYDPTGDIFLAVYNLDGSLRSAFALNDKVGAGSSEYIFDINTDKLGNMYLSGILVGGIVDFDPSENKYEVKGWTSNKSENTFVAIYNNKSELSLAYILENTGQRISCLAVEKDCPNYSLSSTLSHGEKLDVDPGAGEVFVIGDKSNTGHIFVASYSLDGDPDCLITSATNDVSSSLNFNIYPNPTNSIIKIVNNENYTVLKITIFDSNGKTVVYTTDINQEINILDVGHITPGIYFVQIQTNNSFLTKKIIVF